MKSSFNSRDEALEFIKELKRRNASQFSHTPEGREEEWSGHKQEYYIYKDGVPD